MTVALFDEAYDANGKSPAEIERDIAETRAGLGEVLDAIERRMAPRQLLEQGMDRLLGGVNEQIGDIVRENPLPLALIGAGIGWLLLSRALRPAADEPPAEEKSFRAAAPVPDSAYAAGSSYGSGEELAGFASARVESGWSVAAAAAGDAQKTVRDGLSRALDQPLVLGLVGLVAGAALAAALPRSGIEGRWLRPARDRAAEFGREAMERARQVAGQAVEGVSGALKSKAVKETETAIGDSGLKAM